MPDFKRELHLKSPDETCDFARAIAPHLQAGDTILLSGGVGAGKSHFSRCLILSLLDNPEDVPSPTFTLVQTYEGRPGEIWHADLYRLGDGGDIDELGLADAFDQAVCLVEWPDRLGSAAPENALLLHLQDAGSDEERIAHLSWSAPGWAPKLTDAFNG